MKEFGHPIPYDDFWELCDPHVSSCFHRPFDLGHEETGMSNGRMVLRTVQAVHDSDKVAFEHCAKARERVGELDWTFFDFPEKDGLRPGAVSRWESQWKMLRERAGKLARPEVAAWTVSNDPARRGGWDFVSVPRLAVGSSRVLVPVATLQLLRRLPNCEVFVGDVQKRATIKSHHQWLYFRFRSGRGIAASVLMEDGQPVDGIGADYGIWCPRVDAGLEQVARGGLL